MIQYTALAALYDTLTTDVPYEQWAQFAISAFGKHHSETKLVLELACGTGSLSRLLAKSGYEMISCDISSDMLCAAREKCSDLPVAPVFLCQDMTELDLYGTIDGAVCCLDSLNYLISLRELKSAFARVSLFLNRGGLFIFDMKTRSGFAQMSGLSSVQQGDGFFCAWQYGFDAKSGYSEHTVDIFTQDGNNNYERQTELHEQRAYSCAQIEQAAAQAGLRVVKKYSSAKCSKFQEDAGRVFYITQKL